MELPKSVSQIQSKLALESVLCMKGGDGDSSYANNSALQLMAIQALKPILERSIYGKVKMKFRRGEVFRIADFGCGTGRNTFVSVDTIVGALQCSVQESEMPQFQVFFTDLPSNDFNSLFRMLPPHLPNDENLACDDNNAIPARSYFSAAVCGSHFRPLFPQKSLHFCHSSFSLHWISQVPESVQERRSGRVYVSSDCEEAMGAAYLQQFNTDFTEFLKARGREIVDGGCIFISLPGRREGTQIMEEQGFLGYTARLLEYAFEELVNEDIIEREKWDSFYMPFFGPSIQEVESIVKREGSFEIGTMSMVGVNIPSHSVAQVNKGEEEMIGKFIENQLRGAFEILIKAHLGSERLTNEFFSRIGKSASIQFKEYVQNEIDSLVALLIKKEEHDKL